VSKEGAQHLAKHLAEMGYASLTIDQRNIGVFNFKEDYKLFTEGREPIEYKMVSYAIDAIDILLSQPDIKDDEAIIVGVSNGGRIAIIAGALHPNVSKTIESARVDTVLKNSYHIVHQMTHN